MSKRCHPDGQGTTAAADAAATSSSSSASATTAPGPDTKKLRRSPDVYVRGREDSLPADADFARYYTANLGAAAFAKLRTAAAVPLPCVIRLRHDVEGLLPAQGRAAARACSAVLASARHGFAAVPCVPAAVAALRVPNDAYASHTRALCDRLAAAGLLQFGEVASLCPVLAGLDGLRVDGLRGDGCVRALDLCAAPGNKTVAAHDALRRRFGDRFSLVANDFDVKRACLPLAAHAKKTASGRVSVVVGDARTFGGAGGDDGHDLVLADVPCSADGTLRKYRCVADDFRRARLADPYIRDELHATQVDILANAARLARCDGGRVVYSTCSLNPRENESVVAEVLERYAGRLSVVDLHGGRRGAKEEEGGVEGGGGGAGVLRCAPLRAMCGLQEWECGCGLGYPCGGRSCASRFQPATRARLAGCARLAPHLEEDCGGFFVAVLEKNGGVGVEVEVEKEEAAAAAAPSAFKVGGQKKAKGAATSAQRQQAVLARWIPHCYVPAAAVPGRGAWFGELPPASEKGGGGGEAVAATTTANGVPAVQDVAGVFAYFGMDEAAVLGEGDELLLHCMKAEVAAAATTAEARVVARKIVLASADQARLVGGFAPAASPIVSVGRPLFEREKGEGFLLGRLACRYRPSQQSVEVFVRHQTRRRHETCDAALFRRLLREGQLAAAEARAEGLLPGGGGGEGEGGGAAAGEQQQAEVGACLVVLTRGGEGGGGEAVAAVCCLLEGVRLVVRAEKSHVAAILESMDAMAVVEGA